MNTQKFGNPKHESAVRRRLAASRFTMICVWLFGRRYLMKLDHTVHAEIAMYRGCEFFMCYRMRRDFSIYPNAEPRSWLFRWLGKGE